MAKAAPKHTLDETLETIRTQMAELRQTEALEAQIHDMVMAKRNRLDGLMAEFLSLAGENAMAESRLAAVEVRTVLATPDAIAPQSVALAQQLHAQQLHAQPSPTQPERVTPAASSPVPPPLPLPTLPPTTLPLPALPLTTLPTAGAPRDLLQTNGNGAVPTPSAQQVLDSLNRLMSGLKEISAKQGNAPMA